MLDAEMAGMGIAGWEGVAETIGAGVDAEGDATGNGGTRTAGAAAGVGGPEEAGDGLSTTHILCERVATSLATVWARVANGVMWNTGKESLPSSTPRSDRMTEMK
jgi:hypothetical protein